LPSFKGVVWGIARRPTPRTNGGRFCDRSGIIVAKGLLDTFKEDEILDLFAYL
jgi:hypothetical protein